MKSGTSPSAGRRLPLAALLVLLLLAPIAAAQSATLNLDTLTSGELLAATDTPGSYLPLARLESEVVISVSGPIARASLRQRFVNDTGDWLDALYAFPLPEGAAVDRLQLRIGERVIEGVLHERGEALELFEQAREEGQRAALLERDRPNLFTTSLTNLPPGGEIVVEIGYLATLPFDGRAFELRFPLAITPRYVPDGVADAERLALPYRAPDEPLGNPVTLSVDLDAGFALTELESPTHPITSEVRGDRVLITLASGATPSTRDFVLRWTPAVGAAPQAALFTERTEAGGYALLLLLPPDVEALPTPQPRELLFVVDVSGSMAGVSIVQAKAALTLALERLGPRDRLNLIAFNDAAWSLWPAPRPADGAALAAAHRFVDGLVADGGTEMRPALERALAGRPPAGVLRQIVFVTDGSVGNEAELFRLIEQRLGASRLFPVGLGAAPNSFFLRKAAEVGRGSVSYVDDLGLVEETMTALFAKLERPALTDLAVTLPAGAEIYPATVRDLYAGEALQIHARLEELTGEVHLVGRGGGERWQQTLTLQPDDRPGVAQLWARAQIEAFEDLRFLGADPEVIRLAITESALQHGLVTDYTSLLAIERTPVRPADAELQGGELPQNLPEGQIFDAIFGSDSYGYPATATPARLLWLLGLLLLVTAPLLLPRRRGPA
jgi:Ca-activated chloride channel family protein